MHPANLEEDRERIVHVEYEILGVIYHCAIIPHQLTFSRTALDVTPQWVLTATDVDKNQTTMFDMLRIRSWSI